MQADGLAQYTPPISVKIKNLCNDLFVPNHRIWLARDPLAHRILAVHQILSALAGTSQLFATLAPGQMMAFSCHYT